jgi:hypothetical protein
MVHQLVTLKAHRYFPIRVLDVNAPNKLEFASMQGRAKRGDAINYSMDGFLYSAPI